MPISDNNRIAKNTTFLYVRMLLVMLVTLYTSRVVLEELGVDDFGIFNVVGGVVAMLSFFNSSMATSTQRFLNYEMGKDNDASVKKVFAVSLVVHILIALLTLLILESGGLWFVSRKLNIASAGLASALWVYQCSVVTFILSIIIVPYHAAIIANEKMSAYAVISMVEVTLKLGIAFLIQVSNNKLKTYALMLMVLSMIVDAAYVLYSRKSFQECKFKLVKDIPLAKKMLSFSGWMIFGCLASVFHTQGVNILINIFFGPAYNAARAIAVQVNSAVNQFVTNFMTAVRPPVIKAFSKGDFGYMKNLVFTSSKFAFALLFVITCPIILNAKFIISIWLVDVPPLTVLFTQLVVVELLISSLYSPIAFVNQASGKIKNYQLAISVLFFSIFLITWILFQLGAPVYSTFIVSIGVAVLGMIVRLFILKRENQFPVKEYLMNVFFPMVAAGAISSLIPYILHRLIDNGWLALITTSLTGVVVFFATAWCMCLSAQEKAFLLSKFKSIKQRV